MDISALPVSQSNLLALGWWETPQQNNTLEMSTALTQHQQFLKQRLIFRVDSRQGRICTSLCTVQGHSPASSNPACPLPSPQAILLSQVGRTEDDSKVITSFALQWMQTWHRDQGRLLGQFHTPF